MFALHYSDFLNKFDIFLSLKNRMLDLSSLSYHY